MKKQTNRCTCVNKKTYQLNDEFNSIVCKTCFEIVEYERPARVRTIKNNILKIVDNITRHKTFGLFLRNACKCNVKQKQFQLNDTYKTIACENCFEIISYNRVKIKNNVDAKIQPTMFDFTNVLNIVRPDKM